MADVPIFLKEPTILDQFRASPIEVNKGDGERFGTLDSFGEAPYQHVKLRFKEWIPVQAYPAVWSAEDYLRAKYSQAYPIPDESRVKQKLFNSRLDVSACYKDSFDRRRPWFSRLSRIDTAAAPPPSRSFSFSLSLTLSLSVSFE